MINTNETMMPDFLLNSSPLNVDTINKNVADTIPPDDFLKLEDKKAILTAGDTISGSFIINSLISSSGKQSDVYLAKKWGKTYVVKLYRNGWHPTAKMKGFLLNVNHPNIAPVIECGDYNGSYYEIYDYYSEGTLEEASTVSIHHISTVIIPSINEGLRELHRNGVIHCDIKPQNLFYSADKNSVLIGDCGISGFVNATGNMIDSFRGTPEYAPPVRSVMWSAEYSPAYDYAAFGLVICRMILGYSIFEGNSVEAISRAWVNGIKLPSKISGRMETLIKGLLNLDETERWTYNDVKRWCEGEYMRSVGRDYFRKRKQVLEKRPLIFGKFNNEIVKVSNLNQLSKAIRNHWEQSTRVIRRSELIDFLKQFNNENSDLVNKVKKLSYYQDVDVAVFMLLTYLDKDTDEICFCGEVYLNMADYIARLSEGDMIAKKFLSSGLLVFYLREQNANKQQVDKLEQLIKNEGAENMSAITSICYAIQNKKTIEIFDTEVADMEDLIKVIYNKPIEQISKLIKTDSFSAWMFNSGYEKEVKIMNEIGDD